MSDFDVSIVPDELIDIKRWGYAKLVLLPNGDNRKVPCNIIGEDTDHGNYVSKLIALLPLNKLAPPTSPEKDDGQFLEYAYGFSLGNAISRKVWGNGETGLLVLDFDHVCDEFGQFHNPAIAQVIENFKRSGYVERSASGTGFHVFCWKPKEFDQLKPPQKADGKERAVKLSMTAGKGGNIAYKPFAKGCGEQDILEIFWDNRFILFTGKNEGQCAVVPADNFTLVDVVKSSLKALKSKSAGTDAADETPQENVVEVDSAPADQTTPSSKQTPPKRQNKCARKSGTVTHDPDKVRLEFCKLVQSGCALDDSALFNDETPIPAGADASEKAMSVCNYIVNKSRNNLNNADELNWIFTHSPFYKANYGYGKAHQWNDSKASLTYEKALNQDHEDGGKRAAGRPPKAEIISGLPYSNFCTQKGLSEYVSKNLTELLLYDDKAKQWYIKDKDGYCFVPSSDNGYAFVKNYIFDEIDKIEDPQLHGFAEKFSTKANIQAAIDLSKDVLTGIPTDVAYVFDGGKTLFITQDDDGLFQIDVRDTPAGLKTVFRVQGEYWEGTLAECPKDLQEFLNRYGTPQFVDAQLRLHSLAFLCRPIKMCFQFTSDESNTGKSTINIALWGAWGECCYIEIEARELMTGNSTGRRTGLLQAIQKPCVVVKEAEGKISEGVYKEVIDTSRVFSGNSCGKDRIEVQRRGTFIIESNGLIRASNTSAYAERTFPIEFTVKFPKDERLQAKIQSKEWQKYFRGIVINALRKYVEDFNAGKDIETQIREICPAIADRRKVLTQMQDFKLQMILEVAELCNDPDAIADWCEVWQAVYKAVRSTPFEITEWGMTKKDPINPEQATPRIVKDFNAALKRAGFDPSKRATDNRRVVSGIRLHY